MQPVPGRPELLAGHAAEGARAVADGRTPQDLTSFLYSNIVNVLETIPANVFFHLLHRNRWSHVGI